MTDQVENISDQLKEKKISKKKLTQEELKLKKEEEQKDIEKQAKIKARYEIEKAKILEQERKKLEKKTLEKKQNVKNKFLIKFIYSIPEISGDKKFEFRDFSAGKNTEYPIIYTNDVVLYINEEHPNHLKKAIVTHHSIISGKINFVLLFNDPPFVWEINKRTGEKIKTNKKIKVIQNVRYENLKKLGSSTDENFYIKIHKKPTNTANLRPFLEDIFFDNRTNINQNNAILILYQLIIQFMSFKFISHGNTHYFTFEHYDKQKNDKISVIEKLWEKISDENIKNKLKDQVKKKEFVKNPETNKELIYLKNKINQFKSTKKFKEAFGNSWDNFNIALMNFKILFSFDRQTTINELFSKKKGNYKITNLTDREKIKNLKLNGENFDHKKGIKFFNTIFSLLFPDNNRFGLGDMAKYGINNDLDKITFVKNILNKKDTILAKKVLLIETLIEKEINNFIKKLFYKNKRFYPEAVKFKYSGKKTEDEKKLIQDPNKLVPPSESKLFRISKTPEPVVVFQENDFTLNSNGEKVKVPKKFILEKVAETKKNNKTENGLIVVELKLDLNMETVLSPEELLEESKTKSTFRIIGDLVTNVRNKLNCQTSKKDFKKNLEEIGKIGRAHV